MSRSGLNETGDRLPRNPVLGSGLVSAVSNRLGSIAMNALSNPLSTLANYGSNLGCPVQIPDLGRLLQLHYSGYLDQRSVVALAAMLGIHLADSNLTFDISGLPEGLQANLQLIRTSWQGFIEQHRPYYPLGLLRKWTRQGRLANDQTIRAALRKDGIADRTQQTLFLDDYEQLSESVLMALWFRGKISNADFYRLAQQIGWRPQEIDQLVQAAYDIPSASHALDWWQQGLIGETEARQLIHATGWQDGINIDRLAAQRFTDPSLGDVLLAGNRAVAGAAINRFRTNTTDIPDVFKTWAKRLGHNMSAGTDSDYGTEDDGNSWAMQAWANQWRLPDVGMLAQFLHRFRGEPNDPSTWSVPGVQPLTYDEASALLTANGIADTLKPYVFNLMYAPLNLRHIQLIVRHMPVTVPQIAQWLQDNGISPQQSTILAQTYAAKRQEEIDRPVVQQREKALAKLYKSVESAYETGTLSHNDATTELTANGMDGAAAITTLAAIDVQVANRLTEEVIKRARTDVFAGIIPIGAIGPRLVQAGIAAPRVTQIVATWAAQLTAGRKTLGTAKILRYLRKGYITRDQSLVRLSNLGWTGADLLLLLHEVQAEIAADTAKTLAAGEREKAQQERAIEKQLGKTAQLANVLQSRLKTFTPPAKLVKWYKDGVWSEGKVRGRLRLIGYTDDVIDAMLLDALHTTPKAAKKTVAKP